MIEKTMSVHFWPSQVRRGEFQVENFGFQNPQTPISREQQDFGTRKQALTLRLTPQDFPPEKEKRGRGEKSTFPLFRVIFVLLFSTFTLTFAQQRLIVNGQDVAGMTTTLMSGTAYAPALALAEAIGARLSYDAESSLVTLEYASHLLTLQVYSSAGEASSNTQALQLDGRTVAGTGAVNVEGTLYLPVKAVVVAFGGSLSYAEGQPLTVVFPRATLRDVEANSLQGYDRFVLDFDGLTPYQLYYNQAANTLQVRFERLNPIQARGFSGEYISNAVLQQSQGYVDLVLRLEPETQFESYTASRPGGFSFVLDVLPATVQREDPLATPTVVIDAGHGGSDLGLALPEGSEGNLTFVLANNLNEALREMGLSSDLTRTAANLTLSIGERSQLGIGSSLYLSLHAADDLAPAQINVYYLSEASSSEVLDLAIRENARAALNQQDTDVMRRRLLLNLIPDLERGEAYANGIARELSQLGGYTANTVTGLPLKVLEGAAGRGVLIEFSPSNLADPFLAEQLAAAIRSVLAEEAQ
jgi:N-acetylmuramoyl-L-alanine amidase